MTTIKCYTHSSACGMFTKQTICRAIKPLSIITKEVLNNFWVKEESTRKIRKYLLKDNRKKTTYQNLRDVAKQSKGKFTALNAFIRTEEIYKNQLVNKLPC